MATISSVGALSCKRTDMKWRSRCRRTDWPPSHVLIPVDIDPVMMRRIESMSSRSRMAAT